MGNYDDSGAGGGTGGAGAGAGAGAEVGAAGAGAGGISSPSLPSMGISTPSRSGYSGDFADDAIGGGGFLLAPSSPATPTPTPAPRGGHTGDAYGASSTSTCSSSSAPTKCIVYSGFRTHRDVIDLALTSAGVNFQNITRMGLTRAGKVGPCSFTLL